MAEMCYIRGLHPTMSSAPEMTSSKPQVTISEWKKIVAPFTVPSIPRATWQIVNTFVPYVLLWWAMYWSLSVSYWLTLAIAGRVMELVQTGTTWGRLRAFLLVVGVFGDGLMLAVSVFEIVVSVVPRRWAVWSASRTISRAPSRLHR